MKHLIFFIIDILLIILWPIMIFTGVYTSPWMIFLIGVFWCDDIYSAFRHWRDYKFYK